MICRNCDRVVKGVVLIREELEIVSCPQCGYEDASGSQSLAEQDQARDLKTI